jgi:hypothetical protein
MSERSDHHHDKHDRCCTEICFFPEQETYIAEFYPKKNFGRVPFLYVSQFDCPTVPCPCPCQDDYRSLVQFDLCSLCCNFIPPLLHNHNC